MFNRSGSNISHGCHSIPSRFKVMDPNRTTFDSLVRQVSEKERRRPSSPSTFKSLARSVLSPENRIWRQEQIKANNNNKVCESLFLEIILILFVKKAKQLLVIGGKSFIVDDDGNEEELSTSNCPDLEKQDSKHSMQSSESGFNEEDEDRASLLTEDSEKTQLLFTRCDNTKQFSESCSLQTGSVSQKAL